MSRIPVVVCAAIVGVALAVSPVTNASPVDDQFINVVKNYWDGMWNQVVVDSLISSGRATCSILDQGYNSSETMNAVMRPHHGEVRDPIGFMLAATRAYCPQYSRLYEGL